MSEHRDPSRLESACREIRIELEAAKNRIYEAIRNYPPPITACDEQFDLLLEQRQMVSRELDRMRELCLAKSLDCAAIAQIDELVAASDFIGTEARQRIRNLIPNL